MHGDYIVQPEHFVLTGVLPPPFLSSSPMPRAQSKLLRRVTVGPARGRAACCKGRGWWVLGERGPLPCCRCRVSCKAWQMEAGLRSGSAGKAPAPGEGGAAPQVGHVGQVGHLGSGVSRALGSDCSQAGAGRLKRTLGPRIQLWEAAFVSQTLPRRKAMEGVRRVSLVAGFLCVLSSACQQPWQRAVSASWRGIDMGAACAVQGNSPWPCSGVRGLRGYEWCAPAPSGGEGVTGSGEWWHEGS